LRKGPAMSGTSNLPPLTLPREGRESTGGSLLRQAFLARAQSALDRVLRDASDEQLAEALAAPSDMGTVARALLAVGVEPVKAIDPLAGALARGVEHREQLLREAGPTLAAEEVGQVLGIPAEAVEQLRHDAQLLAVRVEADWAYPAFQFVDDDVLAGFADVVARLAPQGPWVTLDNLLAEDTALGDRSLLQVIRDGDMDLVDRVLRQMEGDGYA